MPIERQIAVKCLLKEIIQGTYAQGKEKFDPNFVEYNGMKMSRVNLIATVTNVYIDQKEQKYAFITLDDGTATIRSKAFQDTKPFLKLAKGDLVSFIGKVREYNDERYLVPEVVKKLDDPNFETLRRLEIMKLRGYDPRKKLAEETASVGFESATKIEVPKEQPIAPAHPQPLATAQASMTPQQYREEKEAKERKQKQDNKEVVLKIIAEMDTGEGTPYQDILAKSTLGEQETEKAINELLEEGSCYEPRAGKIKAL